MSVARYFDEMNYGPAPEADTEVRTWLKRHDATFGHFIDGAFVTPSSGAYIDSMEPATGSKPLGPLDPDGPFATHVGAVEVKKLSVRHIRNVPVTKTSSLPP